MDISNYRKDYTASGLKRSELDRCPILQFEKWFKEAKLANINEPNAMSLATVSKSNMPSVRTVLLKSFDQRGFVFYTNYQSQKAREIADNGFAALLFPWLDLERQVRISGKIEKIESKDSFDYFKSRPKGSQIGAWSSPQSSVIESREVIIDKLKHYEEKHKDDKYLPLPKFWGGYRVVAKTIEFWQGRSNRLHDRFVYSRDDDQNSEWKIDRLAP